MTDLVKVSDPSPTPPPPENGWTRLWRRVWESGLGSSVRTQTATWFIGVVIAVLSAFSSHLTEKIKFSINRADSRVKSYSQLIRGLPLPFSFQQLTSAQSSTFPLNHDFAPFPVICVP